MEISELYKIAKKKHISVRHDLPEQFIGLSFRLPDKSMLIWLKKNYPTREGYTQKEVFAHELGHCLTDSFYKTFTKEERQVCEDKANEWAISALIVPCELDALVAKGATLAEVASFFDVSEHFVKKALNYYAIKVNT